MAKSEVRPPQNMGASFDHPHDAEEPLGVAALSPEAQAEIANAVEEAGGEEKVKAELNEERHMSVRERLLRLRGEAQARHPHFPTVQHFMELVDILRDHVVRQEKT